MKKTIRIFAAALSACLLLTACTAAKTAEEQDAAAREAAMAAVKQAETISDAEFDAAFEGRGLHEGTEGESESPPDLSVTLDMRTAEGAYDEIVSYCLAYPHTDEAAYSALNALFEEDLAELKNECAGTIYDEAANRSCIATVEGTCDITIDAGLLNVEYFLSAKFSSGEDNHSLYTVQYDLATCTRIGE